MENIMNEPHLAQYKHDPDYMITLRVSSSCGLDCEDVDTCRWVFADILRIAEFYSQHDKKEEFFKKLHNQLVTLMEDAAHDRMLNVEKGVKNEIER